MIKNSLTITIWTCVTLLALASCHVGPKYHTPYVGAPADWKNQSTSEPVACVDNWWEVFEDEFLNSLEEQAVANNPNIELALFRIKEAWAVAGISFSALFPHLDLNPSYQSYGELFKIFLPPGNVIPIPIATSIPPYRIHQIQNFLPLLLTYEVDLWGKNHNQYRSDYYNAQAMQDAYLASLLSLTSSLATYYFNLRTLDASIELFKRTVKDRQTEYDLNNERYQKGLANFQDVANASLELSNAEYDYLEAIRERGLYEDMIAALVGMQASIFTIPSMPIQANLPEVPAGLPSEMLLRRPDIAQAERSRASEHALINVAYASFFPSLSLTGIFGFLSPDFKHFLTWKSRYWSLGADTAQSVFDAGKRCSELEESVARFYEADATYQQQILTAFQEVEDALHNLEYQKKQAKSLQQSVESAQISLTLSRNRYSAGLVNYIEVVDNERSALTAEQNAVNLLGQRYVSTVQLIKALGGGW